MTKQQKDKFNNLYIFSENLQDGEKEKKKKTKEREKRIKERKSKKNEEEQFDFDVETVIGITNKNNQKKKKQNQVKMTEKQEKIQKRKKKIKRIIKLIFFVLLIAGGIVFALVSPIFDIKEIEVINNEQVSTETIISLSQLSTEQNIFKFNRGDVEEKIKMEPYIESIEIKRKLPNKVEIAVVERNKNFNVEFLNGYIYINNQGYILEISEQKLDLPVIKGISTQEDKIIPGNRLSLEDLEKLETAIQIMDICRNYELETKVSTIDINDKNNYIIFMEEEQKTIYIGDNSNLSNKMLYLPVLLTENKGKAGKIYLNGDINKNFRPIFSLSLDV